MLYNVEIDDILRIQRWVSETPDAPAVWLEDQPLTWSQVGLEVRRVQAGLRARGLLPGRPPLEGASTADLRGRCIAITPALSLKSLLLILACVDAGLPLVLLHPRFTPREQAQALEGLEPLLTLPAEQAVERWVEDLLGQPSVYGAGALPAPPGPEGPLAGIFTSGSTGKPRLVVLERAALLAAVAACQATLRLDSSDRWLLSLPPAHVGGLSIPLRCLAVGASVVLPRVAAGTSLTAKAQRRLLLQAGVTRLSVVPTQLVRLLEIWEATPQLRPGLVGGAGVSVGVLERAYALGIPLCTTWGMTEAGSQITTLPPDALPGLQEEARRGRLVHPGAGVPLPGWVVRCEAGQLCIRGPALFAGYQTTQGVVRELLADGFFPTGDLGRCSEAGVWLEGRRADRIVSGGENVSPLEVEGILEAHPLVDSAFVYGQPDPLWGERVTAAIVWKESTGRKDPAGAPDFALLERWVAARLAGFKRPRAWVAVRGLCLLPGGKLDRAGTLRALLEREGEGTESDL